MKKFQFISVIVSTIFFAFVYKLDLDKGLSKSFSLADGSCCPEPMSKCYYGNSVMLDYVKISANDCSITTEY